MSKRFLALAGSFAAGLLLPAAALATITELGGPPPSTSQLPPTTQTQTQATTGPQSPTAQPAPSCPASPCLAISRVTGFQLTATGAKRNLFVVPRDGWVVAWSITLGAPDKKETAFFDANEGGPPAAGIAVLQAGRSLQYRLVAEGPSVSLSPYFGETAQFALVHSIQVKKGYVVALNVPTWAPALALVVGRGSTWRASRAKTKCTDTTTQAAHTTLGSVLQYACLYTKARLTYTATLISTP
jgi:hypothetical protein